MRTQPKDRGAAAVEMALVLVLLMTLLLGIMEFGRVWAIQGSLAQASRDAARTAAITDSAPLGMAQLQQSFRPLGGPANGTLRTPLPSRTGTPGQSNCEWRVRPTYEFSSLTGFFGTSWTVTATGAMRCNG